jgi:hypothetical protein
VAAIDRDRGTPVWAAHELRLLPLNVFARQNVGVTQVGDHVWLVTFMHYDLSYFDDEAGRVEPIENPFGSKVLPVCSE